MADFRIDKEGSWYYRGMEMTRRDIVRLFYGHLRKSESGYSIEIGNQRCGVEVDDTAYVVRAIRACSESGFEKGIYLILSDDSIEELDPATLRIGRDNVPYCAVKSGLHEARFLSSSYYRLAELIRHDPQRDEYFISVRGRSHYIRDLQSETGEREV